MTTETVHDLIQACLEGVSTAPTDVDVESQRQGKGPQLVAQHPARLRCRLDGLTSGCLEHRCAGLPAATADMSEWDIIAPDVGSRRHARTGGQRKMSGKLFGYARVSVASDADANNLETQRRMLADCEQVFEDVGSGASWNRPGLNRLKAALHPGDCVKVAALDRLGRSLTEVLELLGWLRENGVEIISLRESIDQDSAMGRAMLHLAIVFAEMESDLARERTLAGLERVKATGKHLGRRKGISRKRAEEIQSMRRRDGLSWGRIATITGLPSSSIRRICTWDLEEIAPTAFGEG